MQFRTELWQYQLCIVVSSLVFIKVLVRIFALAPNASIEYFYGIRYVQYMLWLDEEKKTPIISSLWRHSIKSHNITLFYTHTHATYNNITLSNV